MAPEKETLAEIDICRTLGKWVCGVCAKCSGNLVEKQLKSIICPVYEYVMNTLSSLVMRLSTLFFLSCVLGTKHISN